MIQRDDGVLVRVPESKLEQFDPSDTEITDQHRMLADKLTSRLIEKYGNKNREEADLE